MFKIAESHYFYNFNIDILSFKIQNFIKSGCEFFLSIVVNVADDKKV